MQRQRILKMRTTLALISAALTGLGALAARADPMGCLIQPFQEADVGTQVVGVLDQVMVERGDYVKKGQAVALLASDVERASVAAAKLRSEATAELQAAAANHDFAQKKKIRTQDLYRQNFVSQQVRDQAVTEADVAEMRLHQAREQLRQAQQELALAQAQLSQRTIRSPFTGVVVERYLQSGERVEEKPIVKVATVDPLRVEVIVPATQFNRIKQGMTASVRPDMADVELRTAKVVVVDKVIDAASNSFRVRLELANPNNELPPGLRCKVEFDGLAWAPTETPVPAKGGAAGTPGKAAPAKPAAESVPAKTGAESGPGKAADNAAGKPAGSAVPAKPLKQSVAAAQPK
jgi:membrane fusion protein, heavy metal efflux system